MIQVFTWTTVKSIQQKQISNRAKWQLRITSTSHLRHYTVPYSWDRYKYVASTYVSIYRKAQIPSCAGVVESLGSCYHMFARRYSTCCFVGQEQVTTCLPLCCYNTTIFSRQMGTQKGMRRRYAKDLRDTLIYSSSAGFYCSTKWHYLKECIRFQPLAQTGAGKHGTFWRGLPP